MSFFAAGEMRTEEPSFENFFADMAVPRSNVASFISDISSDYYLGSHRPYSDEQVSRIMETVVGEVKVQMSESYRFNDLHVALLSGRARGTRPYPDVFSRLKLGSGPVRAEVVVSAFQTMLNEIWFALSLFL